jgi:hypothetical protein
MEKLDDLLEQRKKYMDRKNEAQSSWLIEMLDDLIFNLDLKLKELTQE